MTRNANGLTWGFARLLSVMIAGLMVVALCGCWGFATKTVPVSGTVTYNGQPVEGAEVAFLPQENSPDARAARGITGPDGSFTLKTFFNKDVDAAGARPGEYTVTVSKFEAPGGMTLEQWDRAQMQPGGGPPLRHLVPERYNNARTSDLTVRVERDGENDFALELHD